MCLTITELIHPWQCSISSREYGVQAGKICNPEAHLSSINASFHIPQRPSFVWRVELIRTEWSDSRKCKAVISSSITENVLIWWRQTNNLWPVVAAGAGACGSTLHLQWPRILCWEVIEWLTFMEAHQQNLSLYYFWHTAWIGLVRKTNE